MFLKAVLLDHLCGTSIWRNTSSLRQRLKQITLLFVNMILQRVMLHQTEVHIESTICSWKELVPLYTNEQGPNHTRQRSLRERTSCKWAAQTHLDLLEKNQDRAVKVIFQISKWRLNTYWWSSGRRDVAGFMVLHKAQHYTRLSSGATQTTGTMKQTSGKNNTPEPRSPKLSHGQHLTFPDTFQL